MPISVLRPEIKLPEYQRYAVAAHVDELFQHYKTFTNRKEAITLTAPIVLGECKEALYLLDGQHRFLALSKILDTTKQDTILPCYVLRSQNEEELKTVFRLNHHNTPFPQLPDNQMLDDFTRGVKAFYNRYPHSFNSQSEQPHRPRISKKRFEQLCRDSLVKRPDLFSNFAALERALLDQENDLADKDRSYFESSRRKLTKRQFDQFVHNTDGQLLYIGFLPELQDGFPWLSENDRTTRVRWSAEDRREVWESEFGSIDHAPCPGCQQRISLDTFEMAHDIALGRGGDNSLDNLFPLCGPCNRRMGVKSREEFIGK